MIVFDLKCHAAGHVFEAWFGSSEDYESQRSRGLVQCPLCGTREVEKAVMAPNVAAKGNQQSVAPGPAAANGVFAGDPESVKSMLAAMAAVQKALLEKTDYVGTSFADDARAIHLGEAAERSIYGKATPQETQVLLDEGIRVAPLPLPVVVPGEEN